MMFSTRFVPKMAQPVAGPTKANANFGYPTQTLQTMPKMRFVWLIGVNTIYCPPRWSFTPAVSLNISISGNSGRD